MGKGTLGVVPDVLPAIGAVLPPGVFITGSRDSGGAVMLVVEGPGVDDGDEFQMVVHTTPTSRMFALVGRGTPVAIEQHEETTHYAERRANSADSANSPDQTVNADG